MYRAPMKRRLEIGRGVLYEDRKWKENSMSRLEILLDDQRNTVRNDDWSYFMQYGKKI